MSPVRRRSRFISRKKARMLLSGVVVLTVVAVCAGMSLLAWEGYHSVYMQPLVYAPPPPPIFRASRKIYPFSIIPGGVYEAKELAQNIELDPSLAEHYRDIRMETLSPSALRPRCRPMSPSATEARLFGPVSR